MAGSAGKTPRSDGNLPMLRQASAGSRTKRLAFGADLTKRFTHDTDRAGQCPGVAPANQYRQATGASAVLPPDLQASIGQGSQPLSVDLRRQLAGTEGTDMQRRIEFAGEVFQLALQGGASIGGQKVQVIKFQRQVPAADGQLPVLAQRLLLSQ